MQSLRAQELERLAELNQNIPERGTPEWDQVWAALQKGLDHARVLTTEPDGTKRPASISDFMLMQRDRQGITGFKHSNTRNYVYLYQSGFLWVPKTDRMFMRGEF